MTGEILLQLKFCVCNVRHFFPLDLLSVFDDFVDFEEIFLCMGPNLGSGSEGNLILDFLPVFSVANNGCDKKAKVPFKNLRCSYRFHLP